MVDVGRVLWVHQVQCLLKQGCQNRIPRPTSRQLLELSKGVCSLQAACASSPSATQHRSAPGVEREPTVLQFVPMASCSGTGAPLTGAVSSVHPSFGYLLSLLFARLNSPRSLSPPYSRGAPAPSSSLWPSCRA